MFDASAFAKRVREHLGDRSTRTAAEQAGVSPATISRACNGHPDLSHENVLRLERWMAGERAGVEA